MDIKKIILYIALALVAMSLWTSWKKEHSSNQQIAQKTAATQTATKAAAGIPVITTPQKTVAVTKIPAARLVQVQTDVLNVTIDTLDGNVIAAKLPKYSKAIDTPKIPVQILSSNNDNLYIAQTGLLGVNKNKPMQYQVSRQGLTVNLKWQGNGLQIIKSFKFTPGSYSFDVNYQIKNQTSRPWVGQIYAQIKRKKPADVGGLFSLHTFVGASIFNPHKTNNYDKISYSKMDKADLSLDVTGGWAAMQQRYFLTAWIPDQTLTHHYYSHAGDNQIYTIGTTNAVKVGAGQQQTFSSKLYVGPEVASNLKPLAKGLDVTIDYGWLWPISIAIFWLMQLIEKYIGNWGWSIVIVTILIKAVFYKLSDTGYKASAKMRELAPKMKALKERYGDDRQQMSKATMELYKKEKINPVSGCLPMIIQIPFFIALYYVLIESVQLRHAPFIFWIHDLSVRDPYFILPILMGASMFFTMKLSPTSLDPTQAKMMMIMPIVMTVLFVSFPAGLVLYWLVNNLASLLQQWYVMRKYSHATARR